MLLEEVSFRSLSMGVVCMIGGVWYKKVADSMALSLDDGKLLMDGAGLLIKKNGVPVSLDASTCLVCRSSLRSKPEGETYVQSR